MRNIKLFILVFSFCLLAKVSPAETTLVRPNVYNVPDSVAFSIGANGASDFVFDWPNPNSSSGVHTTGIYDPTLILSIGSTYTFERNSSGHPFAILDTVSSSYFSGTDGNFYRNVPDMSALTILFTASPAPGNIVSWTPTIAGDYFYTCTVGSHQSMAGLLTVVATVPEPATLTFTAIILMFVLLYRRLYSAKKQTGSVGG